MRYTVGITVERITGSTNHGNEENESIWDYREGTNKQLRSPLQAEAQQLQQKQSSQPISSQPQAFLGKEVGLFTGTEHLDFSQDSIMPRGEGMCTV